MRVLDLFSGIGGFSLGLEAAGMKTVAFCEIDKYCRRVLEKRFPGVPIFEDIRQLTKQSLQEAGVMSDAEPIDLICGGFPCQPFSVAGKQRGKDDDRYLWPEMLRVISEVRPNWVIGENVPGIIKLALDNVLSDLEGIGYTCQPFTIPACAVNAPHKRDRVWIVAYSDSYGRNRREHNQRSRHLQGS
jgi:DNA (cytosine-5)-methyltransferase 1